MRLTWRDWLLAEALWLGVMGLLTLERVQYLGMIGMRWDALGLAWSVNLAWAACLPVVVTVSLRHPLELRPGPVAVHAVTFLACIVAEAAAYVAVEDAFFDVIRWAPRVGLGFADRMRNTMAGQFATSCLAYGAIAGATHAYAFRRLFRDRQLRAARLEAQLARAQLQVLRSELHPHFLFNALHAVSTLMHRDVAAADTMLTRLGDLLRVSLGSVSAHEVTLREELEVLERYVDIERIRFHDRLDVRIRASVEALDGCVPPLLLQPLVENAIRHGIAPRPGPGRVEVRAWRSGDDLRLQVRDDGLGAAAASRDGGSPGVGLANTRRRLRRLYGRSHAFRAVPLRGGGFLVSLRLPFHTVPVASSGGDS